MFNLQVLKVPGDDRQSEHPARILVGVESDPQVPRVVDIGRP